MRHEVQRAASNLGRAIERFGWSDKRSSDRGDLLEAIAYALAAVLEELSEHANDKDGI